MLTARFWRPMLFGLLICRGAAEAREPPRPPSRPQELAKERPAVERFCEKAAPSVEELRIAAQRKELETLDQKVKERIGALEALGNSIQEWISRREQLLQRANKDVIAIYSRVDPEAAALQLAEIDEAEAAAIIAKLPPQTSGAILGEMNATKAGKIVAIVRGASGANETKQ
jgi:flagellar motility protein MotE (MotC chaperone)